MAEWKHIISEWITEYSSLQPNELRSFASEHEHNYEISTAIFSLLYSCHDRNKSLSSDQDDSDEYTQMFESVCTQLFSFYRSREEELLRFTLQFVPTLIFNYLSSVAQQELTRVTRCTETLLIGIYNFEVVDENGKPKVVSFRLPSLAQASIYHEPLSLGPQFLTESALRRWEDCNTKLVTWGPMPLIEGITSQDRLKVMSALLFVYNQNLNVIQKQALRHLCIAASRTVTQGFQQNKNESHQSSYNSITRIPVESNFLIQMINGVYYAMFNEFYTLALQAIKDIDQRAQYELLPDVMLVASAIINTIENSADQPSDSGLDISSELSPSSSSVAISKSMITNASFRTKKLPDDIPIQAGQAVVPESNDVLTSITEEGESDAAPIQRGVVGRSSKPKLTPFSGLGKKIGKEKSNTEKKVTLKESSKAIWNTISGSGDVNESQSNSGGPDTSEPNGSTKDEISITSGMISTENSDSRSQITTDSLDMDPAPRFAAMQVSSV